MNSPSLSTAVMRCQRLSASKANYNSIASALSLEKAHLTRLVRWRNVAKVDPTVLVVRICSLKSMGFLQVTKSRKQ